MNRDGIDQLIKTGAFPDNPDSAKLIETHANWIILADKYVYKIKKPVKYSFLDYSTLQKRLHYCNEELRLNSRTSDIYLDVLPIIFNPKTKKLIISSGKFNIKIEQENYSQHSESLQAKWDIIDHCVCMKKVDSQNLLSKKLSNNQVSKREISDLASAISEFHKSAPKSDISYSEHENLNEFNDILEVLDKVKLSKNRKLEKVIKSSVDTANLFIKNNQCVFEARNKEGFVRDCHGDLHCENIFMDTKPIIFDCIEFNKKFREIDILSEVAFICMDLEAFGRSDLSKKLLQDYLGKLDLQLNEKEKQLLIFYKLYKANVRAKVLMLKGEISFKLYRYIVLMKQYSGTLKN